MVLCCDMRSLCLPSIPPASYRLCGCLAIGDSYEKSRNKNTPCYNIMHKVLIGTGPVLNLPKLYMYNVNLT